MRLLREQPSEKLKQRDGMIKSAHVFSKAASFDELHKDHHLADGQLRCGPSDAARLLRPSDLSAC
jgi:hypothetical protein